MLFTQADLMAVLAPFVVVAEDPYYACVSDDATLLYVPGTDGKRITYGDIRRAGRAGRMAEKVFGLQLPLPLPKPG